MPNLVPDFFPDLVSNLAPGQVPDFVPNLVPDLVPDLVPHLVPDLVPNLVPDLVPNLVPSLQPGNGGNGKGGIPDLGFGIPDLGYPLGRLPPSPRSIQIPCIILRRSFPIAHRVPFGPTVAWSGSGRKTH